MKTPILYIVVPCYNEEACLEETKKQLLKKMTDLIHTDSVSQKSRIVFIDDGSKDKTWEMISKSPKTVVGIKLAHNRGHQNALLAGLMYAKEHCDISISIDADLQDDVNALDKMIKEYADGAEIVYGVRSERKTDSWFKRTTAQSFYKIMSFLGVETVYNSADFRLMSKRALEALSEYSEVNLFLRGIVPSIGFKTSTVSYARSKRFAGESKYSLKKMLNFAWDGISSFSTRPIRLILSLGIIVFLVSFGILIYSFVVKMLGHTVDGWTFTICSIWILGGLQMFALGIVGEYIGKIYAETKHRPKYIIEKITGE